MHKVIRFHSFNRSFEKHNCTQVAGCQNRMISPKKSAQSIAEQAKFVKINEAGVKDLAKEIAKHLQDGSLSMSRFSQCELHPQKANEEAVNWIFLIDTLNFCFWSSGQDKWQVTWKGKTYTGYFALCAAINRAVAEGYSITNPKYYSQISFKDLKYILRGDNESFTVPLLKERQECLHQVGLGLLERYDGKFVNCIKVCDNSAVKLLDLVVSDFECYRDEAIYNDEKVALYKRAQILIGDIWVCFKGKGLGYFEDIEKLTMFADYRIPQVLVHFKAMEYNTELLETLKKDILLKSGSPEEVEIRGCSIHAVELVKEEVKKLLPDVKSTVTDNDDEDALICNSILIDHFLWDYRRKFALDLEHIPFHKTLGIYY